MPMQIRLTSVFVRKQRQYLFISGTVMALAIVIAACATSQLKEQWRDPDYHPVAGQRVLVIAVTGRDANRRTIEDEFVARLRKEGVDAVPSYPQLSIIGPTNLDAVKATVERNHATQVLSVRLVNLNEQTAVSGGYYGAGYYSFYPHASVGVHSPPVYTEPTAYTYKTYTTETRLFDMKSDKQVWAAILHSEEPSNFTNAAKEYADLVVKQMRDDKIVGGGRG